jgi:hypothetical protein
MYMGKGNAKKVEKKKLFGFTKEALDIIKSQKSKNKTETDILHEIIAASKFSPPAERGIIDYMNTHALGRREAIEAMIVEYVIHAGGKLSK